MSSDDDGDEGDDGAKNYKKCGMTRAEYVDVKKFMKKLLKGKSLQASVAAGESSFSILQSARNFLSPNQNYMGFAEEDAKKVEQLWKHGHRILAIGYMLMKVMLKFDLISIHYCYKIDTKSVIISSFFSRAGEICGKRCVPH